MKPTKRTILVSPARLMTPASLMILRCGARAQGGRQRGRQGGRRGQSDTALEWTAINLVMTFIVAIIVVALVSVYTDRDVEAAGVERNAFLFRLVYDDLVARDDPATGRVYPGVIDIAKCDDKRLDAVFVEDRGNGPDGTPNAAQLSAMINITPVPGCALPPTVCFVHRESFFLAAAQSGMRGGSSVESRTFPVGLIDGGTGGSAAGSVPVPAAGSVPGPVAGSVAGTTPDTSLGAGKTPGSAAGVSCAGTLNITIARLSS